MSQTVETTRLVLTKLNGAVHIYGRVPCADLRPTILLQLPGVSTVFAAGLVRVSPLAAFYRELEPVNA
jgi:hypothetical protein